MLKVKVKGQGHCYIIVDRLLDSQGKQGREMSRMRSKFKVIRSKIKVSVTWISF